jgi:hypothetical protein
MGKYVIVLGLMYGWMGLNVLSAQNKQINGLFPGFVLTISGYHLTGQIGEVIDMNGNHSVIFMNDFGTVYSYHPRMIAGFFYKDALKSYYFESKYDGKHWLFLQLLFREKGVSLYQAPERRTQLVYENGVYKPLSYTVLAFFLDFSNGGNPLKLTKGTYKKKLIQLFKNREPALAAKIGKPGYKFQDLKEIIREFTRSILEKDKIIL